MDEISKYLSITAITRYLKYKIDSDSNLQDVFLKGEISNFKAQASGHFYFTLKDENSRISSVMFARSASKIVFRPEDGMKVLIHGKISIYEPNGNYQVFVEDMTEDGVGNLFVAFEQLKTRLEKEGLFAAAHKKTLPKIPRRIGIITAPTGAAIKDIISTLKRRFPICETILFPTLVQGAEAHKNICKQIKKAEEFELDLLIIGRGGGSIEDLWSFNEEDVARAIYACTIPTISAVGHEIDFTIADFVADVRAATPTGAAEIAVPNILDLLNSVDSLKIRANKVTQNKLENLKLQLHKLQDSYVLNNPLYIYQVKAQTLDTYIEKCHTLILNIIEKKNSRLLHVQDNFILKNPLKLMEKKQNKLEAYIEKLEVLNPLNTLKRGYTIVKKDNRTIDNIKVLKVNDDITIAFNQGCVNATIKEIKEN